MESPLSTESNRRISVLPCQRPPPPPLLSLSATEATGLGTGTAILWAEEKGGDGGREGGCRKGHRKSRKRHMCPLGRQLHPNFSQWEWCTLYLDSPLLPTHHIWLKEIKKKGQKNDLHHQLSQYHPEFDFHNHQLKQQQMHNWCLIGFWTEYFKIGSQKRFWFFQPAIVSLKSHSLAPTLASINELNFLSKVSLSSFEKSKHKIFPSLCLF